MLLSGIYILHLQLNLNNKVSFRSHIHLNWDYIQSFDLVSHSNSLTCKLISFFLTRICFFLRVTLANGGYLVIEQTEALVSIDVNGGHCMLGQGTSQEKAILEVNLAAAKQVLLNSIILSSHF